ncbi:MAG TPA: hypothetical protein EYG72_01725 [Candidatus Pacebacteria bacterium]|nr:hypothetical protein [Candidatus Paceibacterota bacterium]
MGFFGKKEKKKDYEINAILPKQIYQSAVLDLKDILAPSALDVKAKYIDLGDKVARTFFIISYPRFLADG